MRYRFPIVRYWWLKRKILNFLSRMVKTLIIFLNLVEKRSIEVWIASQKVIIIINAREKTSQQLSNNVFVSTRTLKKINILRRREFPKKSAEEYFRKKRIQRGTKKWTLRLIWYIFKNQVDSCAFFRFFFGSMQCILRKFPRLFLERDIRIRFGIIIYSRIFIPFLLFIPSRFLLKMASIHQSSLELDSNRKKINK